jgi:hypothetical protein
MFCVEGANMARIPGSAVIVLSFFLSFFSAWGAEGVVLNSVQDTPDPFSPGVAAPPTLPQPANIARVIRPEYLFVKNWTFPLGPPTKAGGPPSIESKRGLPSDAQGGPDPHGLYPNHALVVYSAGATYVYDPSYGTAFIGEDEPQALLQWQMASLDGITCVEIDTLATDADIIQYLYAQMHLQGWLLVQELPSQRE